MAVKRLSNLRPQYADVGILANGYRLFFYASASSTKQNTYNSSTGGVANLNPIVLNALGEPPGEIWLTTGLSYKVGFAIPGSDDPPASFVWTEDVVAGINDTTASFDQWIAGPVPTYINATSFSLLGDQTSTFSAGRRLKTTNTSGTVYSTISTSVFGAGITTVTVFNDSATLDSGLSAVSYGIISATNTSLPGTVVTNSGVSQLIGATAGTNTITGTVRPTLTAYTAGQIFTLVPANTTTGAASLNVDGLGAKNIFSGGAACGGGELVAAVPVQVEYDGTQFNILGPAKVIAFTPAITFGGAAVGVTYATQSGRYTKVGSEVRFRLSIVLSSKGSSVGNLSINALPLTSRNDFASAITVRLGGALGAIATCQGYVNSNTTTITLEKLSGGTATILADTDLGNTSQINISGFYEV